MKPLYEELDILIVEDNPADLFLLKKMLISSKLGISNLYTTDRIEGAKELLKTQKVHLAIIDLSLPDSFGLQSYLGIKGLNKKIPVIILTGLDDTNLALEAIKQGAMDYLVKGQFNAAILTKAIKYTFERIQNIEALHQSNERFNMAVKATNDVIWDWNFRTNKIFFEGDTFKRLFGYDVVNCSVPRSVWETWLHPEDKERVLFKIDNLFKTSGIQHLEDEYRMRRTDGSYAYVYNRGYILYNGGHSAVRMIGAMQDITSRKFTEEKVSESEAKYRHMFHRNPLPSIISDKETMSILEINDSAIEKFGYTREEFLRMTIIDLCYPPDIPKLFSMDMYGDDLHGQVHPLRFSKKDGGIMFMEVTSYHVEYFGKNGTQTQLIDITERIKLEKELTEQQRLRQQDITAAVLTAQERERTALGEELHDNINQILTGVTLFLGIAINNNEKRGELLIKCRDNLSLATNEIRKLSRSLILPGLKEQHLVESLKELIMDTRIASSLKISFHHEDIDEKIIPVDQKVAIYRIIQEQLNNILKHAEATSVDIQLSADDDIIYMILTDDGKGFDPEFRRQGVGITNMISRAEMYKGKVEIETAPGIGCSLKVMMQLKK
jgi:PAS domain S-box-containing protein